MIYAEMEYNTHYSECHHELVSYLEERFSTIEHGLQGDSWIWIFEGDDKVEIDTFYSMKHQIKSPATDSPLVIKVIEFIGAKYKLTIYEEPEFEPHE